MFQLNDKICIIKNIYFVLLKPNNNICNMVNEFLLFIINVVTVLELTTKMTNTNKS
jgi:hypothetical protein